MTTLQLGFGVIGCGLIGRKRISGIPQGCRVVSVYDTILSAAKSAVNLATTDTKIAESVEDIVSDSAVDAVIVATNHVALSDIAEQAITNGKHVLIEKPGAISVSALRRVRSLARENGVVVQVGFNHRFHPSMLMAKHLIESKQYGDVLWVRGRYGHGGRLGYEKEWRADKTISGGGELLDQGSHLIDLTRFFFGNFRLAYSRLTTSFWDMKVEDNAFLALELNEGATAWLHASWTEWKNTFSLEIALKTAKIDISGLGGSYGTESLVLYEMQPEMGPPPRTSHSWTTADDSWKAEIIDFVRAIHGDSSVGASIDDAIANLQIIESAYSL